MESIAIESWLLIMGMAGLALGAVICVARLVRRLLAGKRKPTKIQPPADARLPQFEDEIRVRVFRQQADKAFQSISAVIDEEYKTLLTLIENNRKLDQPHRRPPSEPQHSRGWTPPSDLPRQNNDAGAMGPYAQVDKYVRQGLSTGEISKVLQIPSNEVELAVKLRSARHAALQR
jgi:hypothetical protein